MFNTSTLITLGLTALLCGIIMFYCKRKFAEYEQKLNVMSDLISNIITQLNQIPPAVYDNSSFVPPEFNVHGGEPPANIAMNIIPPIEEDDSSDDNEENDIEEIVNEGSNDEDKRIIVNLSNAFEPETNAITLSQEPLDEDSWDSEESDDEDNSNKILIQENDLNVVVESEILNVEPVTVPVTVQETAEKIGETIANKIVEEVSDSDEVKVIDTNASVEVDYNKLQVTMLKKMVSERKLAQGVSKMKKQELIDLLMNKSQ
jgi:hypothetical protein